MTKIKEILQNKGNAVWSIPPDSTVYEAIAEMASKGVGALAVREGERLVGIISERDYARKVILQGKSSRETRVREIMTTDVVVVTEDHLVDECMALMTDKHIRHLPIVEGQRLTGMVSVGDLVKSIISEQSFKIEQLEQYIRG